MEYVYVLSNPEHPGKVKIGKSKHDPQIRAYQLSKNTGTLGQFNVEWSQEVDNSEMVERVLHGALKPFHHQKEFFNLEISDAIELATQICAKLAEIQALVLKKGKLIRVKKLAAEQLIRIKELEKEHKKKYGK